MHLILQQLRLKFEKKSRMNVCFIYYLAISSRKTNKLIVSHPLSFPLSLVPTINRKIFTFIEEMFLKTRQFTLLIKGRTSFVSAPTERKKCIVYFTHHFFRKNEDGIEWTQIKMCAYTFAKKYHRHTVVSSEKKINQNQIDVWAKITSVFPRLYTGNFPVI